MDTPAENNQRNWLNEIQNKSWEAELLISSGAIYSLFQSSEFLREQFTRVIAISNGIAISIFILDIGVRFLMIYFALHLLARFFWLSLVFLQKLYPEGAISEKLNFSQPFDTSVTRLNYAKMISDFDRYGTLLFSWSITFLFVCLGLAIANGVVSFPSILSSGFRVDSSPHWSTILFTRLSQALLYTLILFYIDTFLHGILRKIKFIAYVYSPIFSFWNRISLGFLWRPSFQLIFSNAKNKWKASLIVLIGSLLIFSLAGSYGDYITTLNQRKYQTAKLRSSEYYYADKQQDAEWTGITIQSRIIKDDYLDVYIPYEIDADVILDSLKITKDLSKVYWVSVDDSTYTRLEWVGLTRQNKQQGINTVLNIAELEEGLHVIRVWQSSGHDDQRIPFWKQ